MEKRNEFILHLKAEAISIILTLVCILIFALLIKYFNLPDSCIRGVNLVIKAVCVGIGTIFLTKDKTSGLKRGFIHGALYIILAFLIFSFLNKTFVLNLSLLFETIGFGIFAGIIGIVLVNLKAR